MTEFRAFPKIPRLFRDVIITEKIDGTNACVVVSPYDGAEPAGMIIAGGVVMNREDDAVLIRSQSRKRFITPENDNFGFAAWVCEHAEELVDLGEGHHYGEWYGKGIQRGYGMEDRRFALFNAKRWADPESRPDCCEVVPTLLQETLSESAVQWTLTRLKSGGSIAPGGEGFPNPEGVVVYHAAGGHLYKVLLDNDDQPKSLAA